MLFTLGVGSATALSGGVITILREEFPSVTQMQATSVVSLLGFLVGLVYITPVSSTTGCLGFFSPNVLFETPEKRTNLCAPVGILAHHKYKTWTF